MKRASSKAPVKRTASAVSRRNRQRGAEFEREVAEVIRAGVGVAAERRLGQARDSGHDLNAGIPYTIEAKRVKRLGRLDTWMKQAARAALATGHPPMVVTRADGGEPYALLRLADLLPLIRRTLTEDLL